MNKYTSGGLPRAGRQLVRETAFRQARSWLDEGLDIRMAVNLSSRVLREPHLAEQIADLIATCGLDPDAAELEITDRVVMDDDELESVVAALHAHWRKARHRRFRNRKLRAAPSAALSD